MTQKQALKQLEEYCKVNQGKEVNNLIKKLAL